MRTIFSLLILMVATGCYRPAPDPDARSARNEPEEHDVSRVSENTSREDPSEKYKLRLSGSRGVLVLADDFRKEDRVRIYNADGTLWYDFSYADEDEFDAPEKINIDFRPLSFHPDYFLVVMRVLKDDGKRYLVVVNEDKNLTKYVPKNEELLSYESWEEHLLQTYAVDFDDKANPVRDGPEEVEAPVEYAHIERFRAEKVEGDWLKLTWETREGTEENPTEVNTGWIRWKKDDHLLVRLYYIS